MIPPAALIGATECVPARVERRPRAPWLDFLLLVTAGIFALRFLALFWEANPDYAFGWGVPFLALYLFSERWILRPPRWISMAGRFRLGACLTVGTVLLLATNLLTEAEPDWRPGLWLGAALYVAGVLAWLGIYGGSSWLRHFSFPVLFLFLGVPWLFNLESAIVQGLMRCNAALVADSLLLADIPAQAMGNTLLLATGRLGVEEACSGIRSLQAALMMSVFLGEFYRFPLSRRMLLPILAVLLALMGNYARLLFLAWNGARHGLGSVEAWHDSAGWGILLFTVAGLWLICLGLRVPAKIISRRPDPGNKAAFHRQTRLAGAWAACLLLAALLGAGFTQAWYAWRESSAPVFPVWTVAWPRDGKDFHPLALSPVTHLLLQDDDAKTGAWTDHWGWRWQALWFRYLPRATNQILFDGHNPETCLPRMGLRETNAYGDFTQRVGEVVLRIHPYRFSSGAMDAYVFWIMYRNRGNVVDFDERHGVYGQSLRAFAERSASWWREAWQGCRGADAQTLETMIAGPPDEAAARRAYSAFLEGAIIPEPPPRK